MISSNAILSNMAEKVVCRISYAYIALIIKREKPRSRSFIREAMADNSGSHAMLVPKIADEKTDYDFLWKSVKNARWRETDL